jgi:hypothetical protein
VSKFIERIRAVRRVWQFLAWEPPVPLGRRWFTFDRAAGRYRITAWLGTGVVFAELPDGSHVAIDPADLEPIEGESHADR